MQEVKPTKFPSTHVDLGSASEYIAKFVRSRGLLLGVVLLGLSAIAGCSSMRGEKNWGVKSEFEGIASWYGPGFQGKQTANGEVFDTHALTAAHRTLPFNSVVEVSNLDNGKRVTVRINDRGPFIKGRVIDLSKAGAQAIDMIGPGTARVKLRVTRIVNKPSPTRPRQANVQYIVQLGAFRDVSKARRLADQVRPSYSNVRVTSSADWHRVQIGPFEGQSQAEQIVAKLNRDGITAIVKPSG